MTLVDKCDIHDGDPSFGISGALLGKLSLKELVLKDDNVVICSETFQAIPRMIRTNQDFESIGLILSHTMADRYELVRFVAQAAEGHASLKKFAVSYRGGSYGSPNAKDKINHAGTARAIGTMLHNAPALQELYVSRCYIRSEGARHLADGLISENSVIETLFLSRKNNLRAEGAGIFARVLLANQNLKSLVLSFNNIQDAGALELAVALRQNSTLEVLDLNANSIHSKGASALADALVAKDSLEVLILMNNSISGNGATSIAEMLTRNESIEQICVGGFEKKGLNEKSLKAFAMHLSKMKCLKSLQVASNAYTSAIGNSFVLALEQNTTLE
jgi:Leucine-rich repeat (LRR) protein